MVACSAVLTKAPFGNAVGARLGQVSQVRVGLRFVKPGCGSNLASRFEALADSNP